MQWWWWSSLGGRVGRRGHFQVSVGATAPTETFLGASRHSVPRKDARETRCVTILMVAVETSLTIHRPGNHSAAFTVVESNANGKLILSDKIRRRRSGPLYVTSTQQKLRMIECSAPLPSRRLCSTFIAADPLNNKLVSSVDSLQPRLCGRLMDRL